MKINVNNLYFKYNKNSKYILKDINIEINSSSMFMLLGLNGCGKTTLIKLIAGLYKPTSGDILIDNKSIFNMSYNKRSKYISYVSQNINNIDGVLVLDYLLFSYSNKLSFYEKPSNDMIIKAKECAKRFNIEYLLDKKINEISGGERQLVSIVSAIIQDSHIIILDEPTSALDLVNKNTILKILDKISKEENKIIIMSSHNPNDAIRLNSKVLLMKNGTIVNSFNAKDKKALEFLKEVYGNDICLSKELDYSEISIR